MIHDLQVNENVKFAYLLHKCAPASASYT